MSKIGVGVGEDFPVDDGKGAGDDRDKPREGLQGAYRARDDFRDDYAEYAARREAYRKWREQRREYKRQWRDAWRARRREFRDDFRGSYYGRSWRHPFFWDSRFLWRVLAVVAIIAAISFTFSHIYFILGALVLLALFAAAFRHGFDPFDLPPRDYRGRHDEDAAPPRAPKPAEPPRDSAH